MGNWHTNIPLNAVSASTQLYYAGGYVARLSLREATGSAPVSLQIYDGSNTSGVLIDAPYLAANGWSETRFNPWDYPFDGGLYLNVVSGSVSGCITIVAKDHEHAGITPVVLVNPEVLSVTLSPQL